MHDLSLLDQVPINIELPHPVPRVHAAKNIGTTYYHELLFESKSTTKTVNWDDNNFLSDRNREESGEF
jgi:hypothetical protein